MTSTILCIYFRRDRNGLPYYSKNVHIVNKRKLYDRASIYKFTLGIPREATIPMDTVSGKCSVAMATVSL